MKKLNIDQVETTRKATKFVIDEGLISISNLEATIGASVGWIYRFLNKNGKGIDDPGFIRFCTLHNYIVDNHPEAFEAVTSETEKEAA